MEIHKTGLKYSNAATEETRVEAPITRIITKHYSRDGDLLSLEVSYIITIPYQAAVDSTVKTDYVTTGPCSPRMDAVDTVDTVNTVGQFDSWTDRQRQRS